MALLLLAAPHALAEPTTADKALARALFDEGRALAKEGKWAEACPKFEESERIDSGIGTLFNLADCEEHLGHFASAWTAFSEVADRAKLAGQSERESIARGRASALGPRLSKIKIRIEPPIPAGVEILIDGKKTSGAVLGTDIPVDPGAHRVEARAPGKVPVSRALDVTAPGTSVVELAALVDEAAPAPVVAAPAREEPAPSKEGASSWQKPAAIGAGALGLVALGVGTVFGLSASSQWADAEAMCPGNRCSADGFAGWQDAKDSATISNVAFATGAVLVAAAVVLWVTAPRAEAAPARALAPVPHHRAASAARWRTP